tara:strand:+ start:154 stop:546 length:393 start_codon:yes stop_codon:yes gene_type:complete
MTIEKQLAEANAKIERLISDCKRLWGMLDSIDTAGDLFKPEITRYFKHVNDKAELRHEIMTSDGYELTYPESLNQSLALHDADVIAKFIHYPECWDTMAYPDLDSAIEEFSHCNTCNQSFGSNSVKEGDK